MKGTFFFVGNRFNVLEEMLQMGLHVPHIFAIKNSYLERVLNQLNLEFTTISSKNELLKQIEDLKFDYFVSNGLPFILPPNILNDVNRKFINVHPSHLPDLRGADPVPGAILFSRDSGATCHFMNEKIDEGDIISQVKLPFDPNWDSVLLYQLSFLAEKEAIRSAIEHQFQSFKKQNITSNDLYYSFKAEDLIINWKDSPEQTLQRIKAFNSPSKGAYFIFENHKFIVRNGAVLSMDFNKMNKRNGEILFRINNNIAIQIENKILYLSNVEGEISILTKKTILF